MSIIGFRLSAKSLRTLAPLAACLTVLALVGGPALQAGAAPQDKTPQSGEAPLVQQFQDVPDSNTFSAFINALYVDNIISGYPCGGPGEPCVAPENLPYYRPNANVTRGQMSKFVDNGRRNIADAVGDRLVMTNTATAALVLSNTTSDSIDVRNSSGAEAIDVRCTRAGQNCWAVYADAATGDRPAYFSGGRGTYARSDDEGYPGLEAYASADLSYGGELRSNIYRAGYVKSNDSGRYSLYVDTQNGPTQSTAGLEVNGTVRVEGNLVVVGSKSGYVVDAMQNADSTKLETGDVVVIVGNSAPVIGEIPVATVKKAASPYDAGVVGIVDQMLYVPDNSTKAAYDAQQQAMREYMDRRAELSARGEGGKAESVALAVPEATITDEQGTVHVIPGATTVARGGYVNVVTLGAYKAVKVDASFGVIHAGDLLTTSPNPGYAMKVTDKAQASGAVIGKALGDLESGTGTVPVMVTLK
jgi:hypothetical protein